MTQEERNEILHYIEVEKAYLDGKIIQVKKLDKEEWHDIECIDKPAWNWLNFDYRVKPEPEREYIDLGLPSGTLWAVDNEEGFYTFDEAIEKFGENMPTKEDGEELLHECFHRWDDVRKGIEILSPFNGNRLFLPAAGYRSYSNGGLYNAGSGGYYWFGSPYSASNGYTLDFDSTFLDTSDSDLRAYGFSVRCVKHKSEE